MVFLQKYRRLIILAIAVALIIFGLSLAKKEHEKVNYVADRFSFVINPVARVVSGISDLLQNGVGYVASIHGNVEKNRKLDKQVKQLNKKMQDYNEVMAENERLRGLLDIAENGQYTLITGGNVFGVSNSNPIKSIMIDRGSKNGVIVGDIVINYNGLVGSVTNVTAYNCKAVLITDSNVSVGARIQRSRDVGIIQGLGKRDILEMIDIPREADIKEGDLVITSGMGDKYPPGLVIGKVSSLKKGSYGVFHKAEITPVVNFNRLEEVLIINAGGTLQNGSR